MMSTEKFETSLREGEHHKLSLFEGSWQGITKTWFEPGVLADESPMKGTIKKVLGGRFIMHEYEGSISNKSFDGIAIYGYQLADDKFQSAWIDSFHMGTGIMLSEGNKIENGISVLGSYGGPGIEKPWGWRTEIISINANQIIITAYNITPEGEEAKAVETVYSRI